MTLADAERNANHTEAESLLNDVFIETSSFNITRARMTETGVDTGTFAGSIQVAASGGTLEFERIQAAVGDTLKITYIDEINTTGSQDSDGYGLGGDSSNANSNADRSANTVTITNTISKSNSISV